MDSFASDRDVEKNSGAAKRCTLPAEIDTYGLFKVSSKCKLFSWHNPDARVDFLGFTNLLTNYFKEGHLYRDGGIVYLVCLGGVPKAS